MGCLIILVELTAFLSTLALTSDRFAGAVISLLWVTWWVGCVSVRAHYQAEERQNARFARALTGVVGFYTGAEGEAERAVPVRASRPWKSTAAFAIRVIGELALMGWFWSAAF